MSFYSSNGKLTWSLIIPHFKVTIISKNHFWSQNEADPTIFGPMYLHRCSKNVNNLLELFCKSRAAQFQTTTEALNLTFFSKFPSGISDWTFINISFVSLRLGNQALQSMHYIFHLHYFINLSKFLYAKGSETSKVSALQESDHLTTCKTRATYINMSVWVCSHWLHI